MKATETTLQELLGGQKQYQVPLYQRTYSWGNAQLSQLWDDILALTGDYAAGRSGSHFMGSLVLAPSPALQPTLQEWLVVDGQQRLTTLSMLLCALRDHLAVTAPEQRERIDDLFLVNKYRPGSERYKLLPTQADRDDYVAVLDGQADAGKGESVGAAYRWFRSAIAAAGRDDEPLDLEMLERTVTSGLSLVVITAHADDNVHRIFESLNNTGVRLTQGDLLRNYFFMRLPVRGAAIYTSVWLPMQELLAPEELELLLWLDLVLRGDQRAKRTDIYRAQQQRLDLLDGEPDLEAELVELGRRARHLKTILDPARELDPQIRERLVHLAAWGSQTAYPLLMHLLDLREQGALTAGETALTMLYLESFLVRRMLAGRSTNNLNRVLTAVVAEMPTDRPVPEAVRYYLSGQRKYWPNDTQLRTAVRSHNFYWTGRAAQRALVLRWLEQSYGSKEPVQLDTLTIEHVLPQTLTEEWAAVLASELDEGTDVAELHGMLVHTLGNLTLTGYNAELSNHPYEDKRQRLLNSGLAMNREIALNGRWGRAEIGQRADQLAERVARLWPGPVEGLADDEQPIWRQLDQVLAAMPLGVWTTYGDLAELLGSHPVPIGQRIATHPTPGGHRVLTAQGSVSPQFRWYEPDRDDDPAQVLAAEGVKFDAAGRAHPGQRFTAKDLADLLGLERDDGQLEPDPDPREAERSRRFHEQLQDSQPTDVSDAVKDFLAGWERLGGKIGYGYSQETSAIPHFLPYRHRGYILWVAACYPVTGTMEFSFQHLKSKEPFSEPTLRDELRVRLNKADGVDIAPGKISVRPSIRLELLRSPQTRRALLDAFAWLVEVASGNRPHVSAA